MVQVLTPLTLGELLDRTIQLYRKHFFVFVGILALPNAFLVPFQLANLWVRTNSGPLNFGASLGALLGAFLILILGIVVLSMAQAATVVAVSRLYLGQSASVSESYNRVAPRIGRLVGLLIVVGIVCAFGYLAVIIPGIWLTLMWSLVVPVMVLEDATIGESMSRSAKLTSGHRLRVLGIYFLYIVFTMVLSAVWEMPLVIATVAAGRLAVNPPFWTQVVLVLGGFVTQCLAGPLLTIALSLVYYDERVRKEAFDLEHLLNQIDGQAPQGALPA
jgi:hypothetical protein